MKKKMQAALGTILMVGLAACSSRNQEKAKEEIKDESHKTAVEAKKAGREIREEAKELGRKVDAAVTPDSQNASDKLSEGAVEVKDAAGQAGVKLDHAALLAKIKTKLASDAGLSTLAKVDVGIKGSVVTLTGTVSSAQQKQAAEQAAAQVDGVTRVHNSLIVEP